MSHIERLVQTLSPRDWAIIETVHRVRIASGPQLERLHFSSLDSPRSRAVKRWQVLKRLVDERVLIPVERRVGGVVHGSAPLSFALDSAGLWLLRLRANVAGRGEPVRRPRVPGERFIAHTLAVSELYVALVEHGRIDHFAISDFRIEPRWPDGLGGFLAPDAFASVSRGAIRDYWWCEVDLATESESTLHRKLAGYVDFAQRGQLGPEGIVPRVLVTTKDSLRLRTVQRIVHALQTPAEDMFHISKLEDAITVLVRELMTE